MRIASTEECVSSGKTTRTKPATCHDVIKLKLRTRNPQTLNLDSLNGLKFVMMTMEFIDSLVAVPGDLGHRGAYPT